MLQRIWNKGNNSNNNNSKSKIKVMLEMISVAILKKFKRKGEIKAV